MIRPDVLRAIEAGTVDLAFRRWDRPRVKVGTRLRTRVGLIEVLEVEETAVEAITDADAARAGASDRAEVLEALAHHPERPVWRVRVRHAGPDPREALRAAVPDAAEVDSLLAWLDRLDATAADGPWTRATLAVIDRSPGVRAPELAAELGRVTAEFKRDVRKLKEKGLTESLDIGYRLSPRGAAVVDHGGPARVRERPAGTPLPKVGAPASRALTAAGVTSLEDVASRSRADLAALHGVGPIALETLDRELARAGLTYI